MAGLISPTTKYWIAPYRIKHSLYRTLHDQPGQEGFINLVTETRKRMIDDAMKIVVDQKLHNPTIYLWEKWDYNKDFLMGFVISDPLTLGILEREQKFNVFEKLVVQTSVKNWAKRLKDKIYEMTTGKKVDPKTLNPYE